MSKIIVHRDPAKINLAVLDLHAQVGDLAQLPTIAADVNQKAAVVAEATGQAVAAAGTAAAAQGVAMAAASEAGLAAGAAGEAAAQSTAAAAIAGPAAEAAAVEADRAEAAADLIASKLLVKDAPSFFAMSSSDLLNGRWSAQDVSGSWDVGVTGADTFLHPNGKSIRVLSGTPLAFGAKGDGVTDDTVSFKRIETSALGPDIDLGGRSYVLTSIQASPSTGVRLRRNYRNGRLVVDGRPLVKDIIHGLASASDFAAPQSPASGKVGLRRVGAEAYEVWSPLGGRYWNMYELNRDTTGIPFNWRGGSVRQIMGYLTCEEGGHVFSGVWADRANTFFNLFASDDKTYIGGRAKQSTASGDYVEIDVPFGGDVFVLFTGRTTGAHVYATLNGSVEGLTLPIDGAGNAYFDAYTAVDLSHRQIVQIASGLPQPAAGSPHKIKLTVGNTRNAASSGYRFVYVGLGVVSSDIGPWMRETDAPVWVSGEGVITRQTRQYGGRYYYADIAGATFTGSISGTTLTVSDVSSGTIEVGAYVGAGVGLGNMTIVSQTSGTTGGVGVYEVSESKTLASTALFSAMRKPTGSTPPTHTSGSASDGSVTWVYRDASGYALPHHRWQAAGSQNEYAFWIKPEGASSFEDVGGALHGNEVSEKVTFAVNGSPTSLAVQGWAFGDVVEVVETNAATHSQIDSGSTAIARTKCRRRWTAGGELRISNTRQFLMDAEIGADYPAGMCAALHYTGDGFRYCFETFWTPGDGYRKFTDFYGQINPIVGQTKDFVAVLEGPCLQPAGADGVPSTEPAPLRMRLAITLDPKAVGEYDRSITFAGKAMNLAGVDVSAGGYSSLAVKMYWQRSDNSLTAMYSSGDVIDASASYSFSIEAA